VKSSGWRARRGFSCHVEAPFRLTLGMRAVDDELFAAIAAVDRVAVAAALRAGADPRAVREFEFGGERMVEHGSEAPLDAAVRRGDAAVVELLLAAGADPEQRCGMSGRPPVHQAAWDGNLPLVRLLLDRGASPATRDGRSGDDLFAAAVRARQSAVVQLLLARSQPADGRALQLACHHGDVELAKCCRAAGAALEPAEQMAAAALNGQVAMLDWLVAEGAAPTADDLAAALAEAAHAGHLEVVRWLLQHAAPIEHRNSFAWTPLHLAAYGGHLAVVELLLAAGADAAALCGQSRTAASWAEEAGHAAIVARLGR
jgi:ankyrin repeat protein